MWLLNTSTAKLRSFQLEDIVERDTRIVRSHVTTNDEINFQGNPNLAKLPTEKFRSRVPPKVMDCCSYAILSHVWGEKEDTFQGIQSLAELPAEIRWLRVSPKVRNCCKYAKSLGFEWVWIDTCCIDKSSSAELSEAINSMYQWYSRADLCIAFLADVPDKEDPRGRRSSFRGSKWFTRGWTLQELIAPKIVVFVSKRWYTLGTKQGLASTIAEITRIDLDVLCLKRPPTEVSIARRMSWAADRDTTRVEDEAYSLMGLFQVNMPTIYGEGHAAFRRLQEEILRSSADHTLFAWLHPCHRGYNEKQLFAESPRDFAMASDMESLPLEDYGKAFDAFSSAAASTHGHTNSQVCRCSLILATFLSYLNPIVFTSGLHSRWTFQLSQSPAMGRTVVSPFLVHLPTLPLRLPF
jgi:hypothetical protein